MSVQGEDAVILADLGVIAGPGPRATPAPGTTPTNVPPPTPGKPEGATPGTPAPTQTLPVPGEKKAPPSEPAKPEPKAEPKPEPKVDPKLPPKTSSAKPKVEGVEIAAFTSPGSATAPIFVRTQGGVPRYTSADFAEPVKVKRVHSITLMLVKGAHPGTAADGSARMAIWPSWAAADRWPVLLAWAATVTELVGGAFVLCGFLTRFWSLGLVATMVVAAWLTNFGPAIQDGTAVWGFLPNHPRFSLAGWQVLLWQLMLAMGGLSLFFAGPGALSIDRLLFGRGPASGVVPTVS